MTQNKIVPAGTIEEIVKRGNSLQEITEMERLWKYRRDWRLFIH
jgi:hypothetical protein